MAGQSSVYLFSFARRAPDDAPAPNRAYHGAEIFYVFHNLHLFVQKWTDWDRHLEDVVSAYWVNFARHGDPNASGLPRWPAYSADRTDRIMMLGDTIEETYSRLDRARIELFDSQYARLLPR
jgi:carboxylesterase type B